MIRPPSLLLLILGLCPPSASGQATPKPTDPPAPSALPLDGTRLVPRSDSFAVMVKGIQLGWTRTTIENTPSGKRLTEESSIAGLVEQKTVVDISAAGAMIQVRQQGSNQGQPTTIELDYQGPRVTGKATAGSAEGTKTVPVDTVLASNPIDDNAIQGLLPGLPWAPNAAWSFLTFSGGQNEARVTTLRVLSTEAVEIGGGTVEVLRVEWAGGWQPAVFWITAQPPFRLVKIGITDTPVEVVLSTKP